MTAITIPVTLSHPLTIFFSVVLQCRIIKSLEIFLPSCVSLGGFWARDTCTEKPLHVLRTFPRCHIFKGHVRHVTARLLRPTVSTSSLQFIDPEGRGVSPVVFRSLHAAKPNVPAFTFRNLKCRPGLWPQPAPSWADADQWEGFDWSLHGERQHGHDVPQDFQTPGEDEAASQGPPHRLVLLPGLRGLQGPAGPEPQRKCAACSGLTAHSGFGGIPQDADRRGGSGLPVRAGEVIRPASWDWWLHRWWVSDGVTPVFFEKRNKSICFSYSLSVSDFLKKLLYTIYYCVKFLISRAMIVFKIDRGSEAMECFIEPLYRGNK